MTFRPLHGIIALLALLHATQAALATPATAPTTAPATSQPTASALSAPVRLPGWLHGAGPTTHATAEPPTHTSDEDAPRPGDPVVVDPDVVDPDVDPEDLLLRRPRRVDAAASLAAGGALLQRSFAVDKPGALARAYASGLVFAATLAVEVYPLAFWRRDALANIGAGLRYLRSVGLQTSMAAPYSAGGSRDSTLQQLEVDLRYRWNILDRAGGPTFTWSVGYGKQVFDIDGVADPVEVDYDYARAGLLDLRWAFLRSSGGLQLALHAAFDYLLVASVGPLATSDDVGVGSGTTHGFQLQGGITLSLGHLFVRLKVAYQRLRHGSSGLCSGGMGAITRDEDGASGACRQAAATDQLTTFSIVPGYAF